MAVSKTPSLQAIDQPRALRSEFQTIGSGVLQIDTSYILAGQRKDKTCPFPNNGRAATRARISQSPLSAFEFYNKIAHLGQLLKRAKSLQGTACIPRGLTTVLAKTMRTATVWSIPGGGCYIAAPFGLGCSIAAADPHAICIPDS